MNKTTLTNEKGISGILVLIAVTAVVGVFILFLINQIRDRNVEVQEAIVTQKVVITPKEDEFEEIAEDESTPEEINNEVLDELDALVKELDEDVLSDDLDDLEL